ncbi:hypothetical protein OG738_13500 [Amycolatopsis sp. NBC_01488]|uniref:hypothetical protein n=1 Tax=Amycolatopsis sp. NBC_01488 TaxID=2903563 RepID=UPI002E2A3E3B|nr:hypothetical protein [Amycolatopsis sp. NBC_01488]
MATDTATDALTDPRRQFLGALMQLSAPAARVALAGMRADDFGHGMAAHVAQLAIETVAAGHAPAPVALYAHAVTTGQAPGEHRRHWLTGWLIDTYRDAPPAALGPHLKAVVLEAAWRAAVATHARRLAQAAEDAPAEVLRELTDDTTVDELWTRYQAACITEPAPLRKAA